MDMLIYKFLANIWILEKIGRSKISGLKYVYFRDLDINC